METKTFKEYLRENGMRPRHFALKHQLCQTTVWKAARGITLRPQQAYQIYKLCDRQIDFFLLVGIKDDVPRTNRKAARHG